jgi:hypothetical protein
MIVKNGLPLVIAVLTGLLTLIGLLLAPALSDLLLSWAIFLAAAALLFGIINLLFVHLARVFRGNLYSGVLIVAMLAVFALAATDTFAMTEGGVATAFNWLQAPLEAAVASLLAFFLLFAGFRLFQRQRNLWSILFLATVVLIMLGNTPLPETLSSPFGSLADVISTTVVSAGMRGILIGIALGAITLSLRLLAGSEQPYNK